MNEEISKERTLSIELLANLVKDDNDRKKTLLISSIIMVMLEAIVFSIFLNIIVSSSANFITWFLVLTVSSVFDTSIYLVFSNTRYNKCVNELQKKLSKIGYENYDEIITDKDIFIKSMEKYLNVSIVPKKYIKIISGFVYLLALSILLYLFMGLSIIGSILLAMIISIISYTTAKLLSYKISELPDKALNKLSEIDYDAANQLRYEIDKIDYFVELIKKYDN